MMSAREIAEIWKEIVKIYKNTREEDSPEETMCNLKKYAEENSKYW